MATYAVGDLQGCDREFVALLEKLSFSATDKLWLLGDLVNRGPDSLAALRRVKALGDQCKVVLGNHDLHFLAAYYGGRAPNASDTFTDILAAPDVEELATWLRQQPLLHLDSDIGYVMTHAGIPHLWSVSQACALSREVQTVLRGEDETLDFRTFFLQMYGDEPHRWEPELKGMSRVRMITNYFTRLRLVEQDGAMDFKHKGALKDAPSHLMPWFELWSTDASRPIILFGHWAALNGYTGRADILALDTGCVWGRQLTALNLNTGERTSVDAFSS